MLRQHTRLILLLLIINIVLRGAWLLYMHPPQIADFALYLQRAGEMAAGHGYMAHGHYTAYWPIGWPLLLSLVFRLVGGPSLWAGLIFNSLLSVGIVLLIYSIAVRITRTTRIAFAAALGYTLLPSQIQWNAVLGSEESFTLLLLISILVYTYTNRRRWLGPTLLAGITMGFACDVRPIPLLFPIFVWLFEWWPNRQGIRTAVARAGTYALGMSIAIAPVTLRNWLTMHHFILVSSNGGVNLWQGMYTNSGYYWVWKGNPLLQYGPYNEIMENKIGEHLFFQHLLQHPWVVLGSGMLKIASLYKNDINATLYTFRAAHLDGAAHVWNGIDTSAYYVFMGLVLIGIIRAIRKRLVDRRTSLFCAAFIVYYTAVFLVFPAWDRFRYPLMPLFALGLGLAFAAKRRPPDMPNLDATPILR